MTISVWRYSHLALAVASFAFILLASVTGIILAYDAAASKLPPYRIPHLDSIPLSQALPVLKKIHPELTEFRIDHNDFVVLEGINENGDEAVDYVDPRSGKLLGKPEKKSAFIEWTTNLHRSLFLHEAGRLFMGLISFLLALIAISGTILIIRRQRGVKRFFRKIVKEHFAQYYHVLLGRLLLIPIIIIALTGAYLALFATGFIPQEPPSHPTEFVALDETKKPLAGFPAFQGITLAEVRSLKFPFEDDPEEHYLLQLHDRELLVNQFNGRPLSDIPYANTMLLEQLSLDLHTGRSSLVWAIVLAASCVSLLFFLYSGFIILRRRTAARLRNTVAAADARFVLLVGSENGSTMRFANLVQQQLVSRGHAAFITQLDSYQVFPKAKHLLVFTATYGLGDPPANAKKFLSLLQAHPQLNGVQFSVLAFGSQAYPDFCRFGFEVHNQLVAQPWAHPLIDIHTVNDKSPEEFLQWWHNWSGHTGEALGELPAFSATPVETLQTFSVTHTTKTQEPEGTFLLRLQPAPGVSYTSGDLLAIYPANDHRERLYSIGKVKGQLQLSVRLHPGGLGSAFLHQLSIADVIKGRIVANEAFHLPINRNAVMMICNGTGIAPFLGMIDQNETAVPCHLYCGQRTVAAMNLYDAFLAACLERKVLSDLQLAFSREGAKQYVTDLVRRDASLFAACLSDNGVIMICGSLSMEKDVLECLAEICVEATGNNLSYYQSHGQVLSDCY